MDETDQDQEMSEEVDSDNEAWAGLIPGPHERTEQCQLGQETLNLPELFLEKKHIFTSVLSMDTWDNVLSPEKKKRLEALLPDFPSKDAEEKKETVRRLLSGENFKFGNPIEDLQKKLKEGYLQPEIARYRKQTRLFRYRDYKMKQQRHMSDLLKQLLLSRQELFEQVSTLAPGEPIKFQYRPPVTKKSSYLEQVVRKKTIRILKEVREESGIPDTSSDEDDELTSPVQRSRRQLFKSLGPIPSPEPTLPSVVATFASKPPLVNGDVGGANHTPTGHVLPSAKRPRPISPVEVTEESYKLMLRNHKKKKVLEPELPELDTSSVSLQDILSRCQANKKHSKAQPGESLASNPATMKKRLKMKGKGEKKKKVKSKESPMTGLEESPSLAQLNEADIVAPSLPKLKDVPEEPVLKAVYSPATNFFCLLRDILSGCADGKTTTNKVEDRVREWVDVNDEIANPWMALQNNWVELVVSALKFLSGNELGMRVENFVPFIDYKERAQQWKWIGVGRDSDPEMTSLFRYWLQHKDDVCVDSLEPGQGSPPPPKAKTNFIVRPTSSNEKALFREQERRRFAAPHKAFTFMMHGYDSVVGPVKGVYDKDSGTNKAREHNLLVSDRPPFVTILTLVRDAAARLPNGEGTRGDICELLKDSQFLAPGVTETQINAVVSGALDRLHSEKDPCVKYDVTRKLWIYLHRNRTEDEFERIHQAQAAVLKAKKTLQRPKSAKGSKESPAQPPALTTTTLATSSTVNSMSVTTAASKPTFTLSTLSTSSTTKQGTEPSSPSILGKTSKAATSLVRSVSHGPGLSSTASPGLNLPPTVAQLRAAQAAMAKSASTVSKLQTVKQLTSGVTTASNSATTSSVLTVTSVGLTANSSLAAQLLYSPGLGAAGVGKVAKQPASAPVSTATTFSLVTSLNVSQQSANATTRTPTIPTISMLHSQQFLKQQQLGAQSMLKQNAALVAAVGQSISSSSSTSQALTKAASLNSKHTFSMAARQTPPPNVSVTKNQAAVVSSAKGVSSVKQASLILSQEGVGSLSAVTSTSSGTPTGKLVALTSMPGSVAGEGTMMAQIVHQATGATTLAGARVAAPPTIRLQSGNLVQPVIGGKPIQIGGKPFAHTKAGLVQLAGKGGQPLGLIRTPQGPLSAINLMPLVTSANVSAATASKAATVVAVNSPGTAVLTSAAPIPTPQASSTNASKTNAMPRVINPAHAGLVVTQLSQGNIALRSANPGSTQAKVIPAGQATGLLPTQFILQHAPTAVSTQPSGGHAPLIVSNAPGAKGAQNLQVMRTVLSQQGNLKPGQATILISQPAVGQPVSSTTMLTPAQVVQSTSKSSGRGSPKGKSQPVYARIITPPPGMKLTGMAQVPAGAAVPGMNMIPTKLLATSAGLAPHGLNPNLPMVSLAVPVMTPTQTVVTQGKGAEQAANTTKVGDGKPDGSGDR